MKNKLIIGVLALTTVSNAQIKIHSYQMTGDSYLEGEISGIQCPTIYVASPDQAPNNLFIYGNDAFTATKVNKKISINAGTECKETFGNITFLSGGNYKTCHSLTDSSSIPSDFKEVLRGSLIARNFAINIQMNNIKNCPNIPLSQTAIQRLNAQHAYNTRIINALASVEFKHFLWIGQRANSQKVAMIVFGLNKAINKNYCFYITLNDLRFIEKFMETINNVSRGENSAAINISGIGKHLPVGGTYNLPGNFSLSKSS